MVQRGPIGPRHAMPAKFDATSSAVPSAMRRRAVPSAGIRMVLAADGLEHPTPASRSPGDPGVSGRRPASDTGSSCDIRGISEGGIVRDPLSGPRGSRIPVLDRGRSVRNSCLSGANYRAPIQGGVAMPGGNDWLAACRRCRVGWATAGSSSGVARPCRRR
jgi:hypothetical protein